MGRIGGIPVMLSWSWLASVVVIVLLAGPVVEQAVDGISRVGAMLVAALLAVLLGASVLIHELGHCLAARALGLPVIEVRLYLLGGVSELGRMPASAREEAVIAAAGPALSALLSGVFFLLIGSADRHTVPWLLLGELALSNAIVAIFNVLPALPLDGGRVLRAGVWQLSGRRRWGTVAASVGGYLVAVALVVWAVVVLTGESRAGILQAAIAVATAAFVAFGAWEEQRQETTVDAVDDLPLTNFAMPVVQLPAETPVALALQAAGGRAVVLTGADGFGSGVLNHQLAVELASRSPHAPAVNAAEQVAPELVVLPGDLASDVLRRWRERPHENLVLVDDNGTPIGVIRPDQRGRITRGEQVSA